MCYVVLCCVLSEWRGCCFISCGGCWFQGLVWTALPLDRPFPWTALPLDRPSPGPPKISLSFFPLPPQNSFFFFPLWGSSREILVVFLKAGDPQMCMFGVLGLSSAPKPPGLHTTARELQTCTFEGPGLQKHHQNSTRRHPEREEKNEFWRREREKKERNFGRSRGRAVQGKGGPGEGRSRGRAVQTKP